MKAIFCLGLISASLIGCSQSDDSKKFEDNVTYDYDTKSCVYGVDEGGVARFEKMTQTRVKKAAFNKAFNYSLFEGVAAASVAESMNFISGTNVSIYKTEGISTNNCERNLFSGANEMPSDIRDKWAASSSAGTMAIYFPKGEPGLSSNEKQASIIIRVNTNRWTLVHEFMHHLFELKSVEEGVNTNEIKAKLSADFELFVSLSGAGKSEDQLARLFERIVDRYDSLMIHYTLEEIAIETFMKEQKRKGVLKYAPESSNWYINESAKKAIEGYGELKTLARSLSSKAYLNDRREVSNRMDALIKKMDARISEINIAKSSYPDYSRSLKLSDTLGLSLGTGAHDAPCSHDQEMDSIFQAIKNLN